MAPSAIQTTVLPERTRETWNDVEPYSLAIERIRVAIERHRTNKLSLKDGVEANNVVDGILEDSHRSQSPVTFTSDAQTIEDIWDIVQELERNHRIPPPKFSHDSSKIDSDLATADDSGQITAPPVSTNQYP